MDLINFWKQLDLENKPYIHPKDVLNEKICYSFNGITNYFSNKYWSDKGVFHTDLVPMPYLGNLSNAKIFFLLLNPGFSFIDYYAEENSKAYRDTLVNNLNQDFSNTNFPFPFLNPEFLWTGGGQYWFNKFKDYILEIKEKNNFPSMLEATEFLSQNIAILEIFPYHSISFSRHNLLNKNEIESVTQMKKFVNDTIIPKVKNDEACIICTRQTQIWNLPIHKNIVIYEGTEARSAHISKNTRAYPIITKFLYENN